MYKVIVFVPREHKEEVKNAMFAAGGGALGKYTHCAFETEGKGQFKPGPGSNPFLGEKDEVTIVQEVRVEMLVVCEKITSVLRAMKKSHPYEEVAYDVFRQAEIDF